MEKRMSSKRFVRLDFKGKCQNLSALELFENICCENNEELFPITLIWLKWEKIMSIVQTI